MVDNILGQGVDVHLLGLREQSKLMGVPMKLFNDESFRKFNHFSLSTSQVSWHVGANSTALLNLRYKQECH